MDKLLNYIRYWQASGESVKTSIRVKTRLEQLTTEGLYTGGTVTYGYSLVDNGRTNKRNQPVLDFAIDEDAAEVIRLIFKMYVYDGYGAQRLCRYLAEHGIYRADGRNFPNTSINRIIKNKMYLGIVHNGEVESEVIPALQIIDRETFDKAQQLMINRATHHRDTPLNMSGRSLLVGNIYCGHCGNRLTLATSGRKRVKRDGTVIRETRFRYQCHYGVRHPGACDGQSGYSVPKVDDIVEKVVIQQFAKFRSYDGAAIVDQAHNDHITLTKAQCARLKRELTAKQKELADYQTEIIRVIRGESRFTEEMLTYLIKETQAAADELSCRLEAVQAELTERMAGAAEERKEYKKIKTWASFTGSAPLRRRR